MIMVWLKVMDVLTPVSYTHLDVYKRQASGSSGQYRQPKDKHRPKAVGVPQTAGLWNVCRNSLFGSSDG